MDCMEHDLDGVSKLLHCILAADKRLYFSEYTDSFTRMKLNNEMFVLNFVLLLLDKEDFYYDTVKNHFEELMKE